VPIRFRCAYCNQLMGIARRKAGTVVRCPTCSGQVVVPDPGAAAEAGPGPGPANQLFEGSDFDQIFNPVAPKEPQAATVGGSSPEEKAPGWGTHAVGNLDLERLDASGPAPPLLTGAPPGILLSPSLVTLLMVVGILLLALVFGAGILVGKYVFGS
jgi:hypothetical protein